MIWFSSPTRLNQKKSDNGTKVAKLNEVVDMTVEATPRMCLSRSVSAVLYRSPEKDWDVDGEMKSWELEKWPVLLPYDSEDDLFR